MGFVKNAPETVRFTQEGNIPVRIVDCDIAEPRFSPNDPDAFDVCLKVESTNPEIKGCDWWTSEYSQNYGTGNNSTRTRADMTEETLRKLGLDDGDLTKLKNLIGIETIAWIKKTEKGDKTYYNVAGLGGRGGADPTGLDSAEIKRRFKAQKTGISPNKASAAKTTPAAQSTIVDPFADDVTF